MSNNSSWEAFYLNSALFNGFEKFRLLLHWNPSVFPKKNETLTALTIPKQYYALKPIVIKTFPNLVNFETFKYFWKEKYRFFQENPFFECYEGSQPKRTLETLLNKTKPRAAALRKLMSVFEKNNLSSQKNLNSERFCFENSWAKAMLGRLLEQIWQLYQFFKKSIFFQKTFGFSRKERKVRTFWEIFSIFTVRMLENHTTKTLLVKAILKTMKFFPKNPHVILQ